MTIPKLGKVGLVACGGGYKVAFTIGVCKCLTYLGIDISIVSAVSGSALTLAAWIADDFQTKRLEEEDKKIDSFGDNFVFNKKYIRLAMHLNENSLFGSDGLLMLINGKKEAGLGGINIQKLLESKTELCIALRNETDENKRECISNLDSQFKKNPQKLKLYLQATASPMGFLQPVKIDESFYSDGMYPDIECAIQSGCDTIFIIYNEQPPIDHIETLSWLKRLPYNISTMHDDIMEKEIEKILKTHHDFVLIEGNSKTPWVKRCYKYFSAIAASAKRGDTHNFVPHRIIVLSPEKPMGKISTVGFDRGDLQTALQHGYDCTLKAIENL